MNVQRERRAREVEERQVHEDEQKRLNEERKVREERQKVKYAEEVAAARLRRERQRSGSDSYSNVKEIQGSGRQPSHSRPAYDSSPPPSSSTKAFPAGPKYSRSQSHNESSVTSRPPSLGGSPSGSRRTSIVQAGPSSHHSSYEDIKKDRRQSSMSQSSEQHMAVSHGSSKRSSLPRSFSSPQTSSVYANYPYIGVPPVPALPWDMPLLPPSPAFMQQQVPRSNSRSSSNSRNSSPLRLPVGPPATHSSDSIPNIPAKRPQFARFPSGEISVRQQYTATRGAVDDRRASYVMSPSQPHSRDVWPSATSQIHMNPRGRTETKRQTIVL